MFGGALCSKEIKTLHNVTFFSELSHGHFSANITKFSEQLSLTPFLNYFVNVKIRQHPLLKTASVQYLKSIFSLSQFN